jgi:hypothetical protein
MARLKAAELLLPSCPGAALAVLASSSIFDGDKDTSEGRFYRWEMMKARLLLKLRV